jgi:hypothetical protein
MEKRQSLVLPLAALDSGTGIRNRPRTSGEQALAAE